MTAPRAASPNTIACRSLAGLLALLLWTGRAAGQEERPESWRWMTDPGAADTTWVFNRMPPGWHITTGPGVITWDEAASYDGRYAVESEMILFPSTQPEGFGLFLAGRKLAGTEAQYVAFLIRKDGAAGVFRVRGAEVEPLVDWAPAPAVKAHPGTGTVSNTLRVQVEPNEVVFLVNGEPVARVAAEAVAGGGRTGFRIGPDVNVHVTTLDVLQRLAPPGGT